MFKQLYVGERCHVLPYLTGTSSTVGVDWQRPTWSPSLRQPPLPHYLHLHTRLHSIPEWLLWHSGVWLALDQYMEPNPTQVMQRVQPNSSKHTFSDFHYSQAGNSPLNSAFNQEFCSENFAICRHFSMKHRKQTNKQLYYKSTNIQAYQQIYATTHVGAHPSPLEVLMPFSHLP